MPTSSSILSYDYSYDCISSAAKSAHDVGSSHSTDYECTHADLVVEEDAASRLQLGLVHKGHDIDIVLWTDQRRDNGMAA